MPQFFRDFINFIKAALGNGTITEDNANNWIFVLTAIALSFTILSSLWKFGSWIAKWRRRKMLINDLAPYYTKADIYQATTNYIPTKYQYVAPSEDGPGPPRGTYGAVAEGKMIPLFLNKAFNNDKDDTRYYLILADAGMGKTTFMINLYLAYKRQWKWWNRRYDIKVLPLGHPASLNDIEEMDNEAKKNTILLLDALDEDIEAVKDYRKRMQEVLDVAWRFREIVLTCRTQFFPSQDEEPTNTGYFKFGGKGGEFKFQKLYVSVFDDKDIKKYLRKRFNFWNPFIWNKLKKARNIVEKSPNLVMRPMLLSHIEELVDHEKTYEYTFQIYEVMIEKWIEREADKPHIEKTYGSIKKFKEQLFAFSQSLAVNLYLNQSKRGVFYISKDEKIDSDSGIQLSGLEAGMEISLKESGWRSRSLLNRNSDGFYKFSHKSILEYFLAKAAIENPVFGDLLDFGGLDTALLFRNEMFAVELSDMTPNVIPSSDEENNLIFYSKKSIPLDTIVLRSANLNKLNALRYINLGFAKQILIVINEENYPSLYLLYVHIYSIRELESKPIVLEVLKRLKVLEVLEVLEVLKLLRVPELLERLNLQNWSERPELSELLELHERLNRLRLPNWRRRLAQLQLESQNWDQLSHYRLLPKRQQVKLEIEGELLKLVQEIHELLQPMRRQEVLRLLLQIKEKNPEIISELRQANEFIKQCQALEKKWPKVKFIY